MMLLTAKSRVWDDQLTSGECLTYKGKKKRKTGRNDRVCSIDA